MEPTSYNTCPVKICTPFIWNITKMAGSINGLHVGSQVQIIFMPWDNQYCHAYAHSLIHIYNRRHYISAVYKRFTYLRFTNGSQTVYIPAVYKRFTNGLHTCSLQTVYIPTVYKRFTNGLQTVYKRFTYLQFTNGLHTFGLQMVHKRITYLQFTNGLHTCGLQIVYLRFTYLGGVYRHGLGLCFWRKADNGIVSCGSCPWWDKWKKSYL